MENESIHEQEVPVGLTELADNHGCYSFVTFCDTCRKKGTADCHLNGRKHDPAANYAYVSGAYPWDCIFCNRKNGKPIDRFENEFTFSDCPYLSRDLTDDESAKADKWGCIKLDEDGEYGDFCECAVRRIVLKTLTCYAAACGQYDFLPHSDHAHSLWDKTRWSDHPMSFKCMREYAAERKCETLYDLLLAYDSEDFLAFCKSRNVNRPERAVSSIKKYAEVYGWFWIGGAEGGRRAFRKGTVQEQNIRVAKTFAAAENKYAREIQAALKSRRDAKKKKGEKK